MRKILCAGLGFALTWLILNEAKAQNNVGIGTLNPRSTAILDVVSSDQGILLPRVDMTSMTLGLSDHGMIIYDTVMGGFYVWDGSQFLLTTIGDTARWGVNGSDIYNLNPGYVGIGTSIPSEYLHVSGDENGGFVSIVAENTNANGIASFDLVNDSKRVEFRLEGSGGAQDFWIWDSNEDEARLIIDDAGLVGIGDWNPQTQFDVTDSLPGGTVTIEIENLDATGTTDLALWNDNTYFALAIDGSSAGFGVDDDFYIFNGAAGDYSWLSMAQAITPVLELPAHRLDYM